VYKDLGLLTYGQLIEIAAADLAGATARDTATQVAEVIKPRGALLLITGAHTWHDMPDRGQHLLGCLYQQMTAAHRDYEGGHPGELAIILSGRKDPLHALLAASPALAARFPAIINFPGYTPAQLANIVTALASEAGLCLTPRRSASRHRQCAPGRPPAEPGNHQPGPPRHRRIPPPRPGRTGRDLRRRHPRAAARRGLATRAAARPVSIAGSR
jgi:hypothetical protein